MQFYLEFVAFLSALHLHIEVHADSPNNLWDVVGPLWTRLEPPWKRLGNVLCRFRGVLGRLKAVLGRLGNGGLSCLRVVLERLGGILDSI